MTNAESRQLGCSKLIDRYAKVVKLGTFRPDGKFGSAVLDGIYVPLPEYGIALVYEYKPNDARPTPEFVPDLGPNPRHPPVFASRDKYFSAKEIVELNDVSAVRCVYRDGKFEVRAWTSDLDEIGGNLKGYLDLGIATHNSILSPFFRRQKWVDGKSVQFHKGTLR